MKIYNKVITLAITIIAALTASAQVTTKVTGVTTTTATTTIDETNGVTINTFTTINEASDTIDIRGYAIANGDTVNLRGFAVMETPGGTSPVTPARLSRPVVIHDLATDGTNTTTLKSDESIERVLNDLQTINTPATRLNIAKRTKKTPQADPFQTQGLMRHFTWGLDVSSGVDVSAHDMSMFCFGGALGYKNAWLRFLGAGADVVSMINNSSRFYPVYAMVRTSFSPYYQMCFLEAKAGVAFTSITDYQQQTNLYGSIGVGFTLAHSRIFSSHLVIRYTALPLHNLHAMTDPDSGTPLAPDMRGYLLSYACIGLGIYF